MSDFALPRDLREGMGRLVKDVPGNQIAERAKRLSDNYLRGRSSQCAVTDSADIAAYLTVRLPATYAAVSAALDALKQRAPDFAPRTLLDAGAGPGTASWAVIAQWPDIESVTMVDENETMLKSARALCAGASQPALRSVRFAKSAIARYDSNEPSDLVVAGYVFAELRQADRALQALWQATRHVLLIVEPGTPEGYARINAARELLIEAGAKIAAPCPHEKTCPIQPPDWCHFAQRLSRSRDHMRAKGASLPFEDEKFSYLAAVRGLRLKPTESRILDRPAEAKFGTRFKLCTGSGISEQLVQKRDKAAYRRAASRKWGDTLDVSPLRS